MQETQDRSPGREDSPGEGNGNPLQYSCLENSMDGGAWWATVYGVAKCWTLLSDFTFTFTLLRDSMWEFRYGRGRRRQWNMGPIFFFSVIHIVIYLLFFSFIFISWRLITLQYCSGFCHTLTWISHGFTCIPHPGPPSHLPLYPIPLGLPSAPGPSTCLMHPAWAGDLFHPR